MEEETCETWAPLFSDIIASSIWGEAKEVKILWITMLALKNRVGYVGGSVPGLARIAGITVEECEAALKVLESPDAQSRSQEYGGRRIERVERGWKVLNHFAFRDRIQKAAIIKEQNRIRQKKFRDKKNGKIPSSQDVFTPPTLAERIEVERMKNE